MTSIFEIGNFEAYDNKKQLKLCCTELYRSRWKLLMMLFQKYLSSVSREGKEPGEILLRKLHAL